MSTVACVLVAGSSSYALTTTALGVDEQYASRHCTWLHCPARDSRRSCRVVRGFAVRAAAASDSRARHCIMESSSLSTRRTAFSDSAQRGDGSKPGALFRLRGNRRWPHMAPWNTQAVPIHTQPDPREL
jgi:hypothetical protein